MLINHCKRVEGTSIVDVPSTLFLPEESWRTLLFIYWPISMDTYFTSKYSSMP